MRVASFINSGRLRGPTCEVNVVHHCNLSCQACCHLSPALPKHFANPAEIERDLARLSRWYRADRVRLLGGEPLLHPDLPGVIAAVRRSGISERINVATNGTLLDRMPEAFWKSVDEIELSLYPETGIGAEALARFAASARTHGVEFGVLHYSHFRQSHSEQGTQDTSLTKRIFTTCQIAHHWKCHTVDSGFFYRCPQSLFLSKLLQGRGIEADGLPISDSPSFGEDLRKFLGSRAPLRSCQYCLGSAGQKVAHRQVPRRE